MCARLITSGLTRALAVRDVVAHLARRGSLSATCSLASVCASMDIVALNAIKLCWNTIFQNGLKGLCVCSSNELVIPICKSIGDFKKKKYVI